MAKKEICPCLGCIRVQDSEACDNKACKLWQNWFVTAWADTCKSLEKAGFGK